MTDGRSELARRVACLDAGRGASQVADAAGADLAHFVQVLERITSSSTPRDVHAFPWASAEDADALLGNSRLLARLAAAVPEIVTGPLRLDSQYWVGTTRPSFLPPRELTLNESGFVGVSDDVEVSTKPFGVGLFTSTGVRGTYGMWRIYLDLHQGSTLSPLPWHTWALEPSHQAVVREIASASDWVELVLSHPRRERGLLFPDWRSVARRFDAVHMTLRAISATQGLCFPTDLGLVASAYWDVECTFWLRWRFDSIRLVETVT